MIYTMHTHVLRIRQWIHFLAMWVSIVSFLLSAYSMLSDKVKFLSMQAQTDFNSCPGIMTKLKYNNLKDIFLAHPYRSYQRLWSDCGDTPGDLDSVSRPLPYNMACRKITWLQWCANGNDTKQLFRLLTPMLTPYGGSEGSDQTARRRWSWSLVANHQWRQIFPRRGSNDSCWLQSLFKPQFNCAKNYAHSETSLRITTDWSSCASHIMYIRHNVIIMKRLTPRAAF